MVQQTELPFQGVFWKGTVLWIFLFWIIVLIFCGFRVSESDRAICYWNTLTGLDRTGLNWLVLYKDGSGVLLCLSVFSSFLMIKIPIFRYPTTRVPNEQLYVMYLQRIMCIKYSSLATSSLKSCTD